MYQNITKDKTNIGDEGTRQIGNALKVNHGLKKLVLSDNEITEAKEVADSLKVNVTLKVLFISMNKLNNKQALYFVDGLLQNRNLTFIDLSNSK